MQGNLETVVWEPCFEAGMCQAVSHLNAARQAAVEEDCFSGLGQLIHSGYSATSECWWSGVKISTYMWWVVFFYPWLFIINKYCFPEGQPLTKKAIVIIVEICLV